MEKWLSIAALLIAATTAPANAIEVVASVKPIHSLVAGVMLGTGNEPSLIVDGANSPHGFSMRPSDADGLSKADIVFWVGDTYEMFLVKTLPLVAGNAVSVPLIETDGVQTLPFRAGGLFEADAHEGEGLEKQEAEEDEGAGEGVDPHIWLDPRISIQLVDRIAAELSAVDPVNAAVYTANAETMRNGISELEREISEQVSGLDASFFVFHDAYHYFERRFDVTATGTFTINPSVAPGARRVSEIQQAIVDATGVCLFTEPQFSPALISTLVGDTGARTGVLDPLGADIADGPDLYFNLMRGIARSLKDCLAP